MDYETVRKVEQMGPSHHIKSEVYIRRQNGLFMDDRDKRRSRQFDSS